MIKEIRIAQKKRRKDKQGFHAKPGENDFQWDIIGKRNVKTNYPIVSNQKSHKNAVPNIQKIIVQTIGLSQNASYRPILASQEGRTY
jgi:hypothetical protein